MKTAQLGDTIKHNPSGFQGETTRVQESAGRTEITLKASNGEEKTFKLDGLEVVKAAGQ
jgi:hypothetical protein